MLWRSGSPWDGELIFHGHGREISKSISECESQRDVKKHRALCEPKREHEYEQNGPASDAPVPRSRGRGFR